MKRRGKQVKGKTQRHAAASQRELARMLGVAANAVSQYVRDDTWTFGRSGPYDVAKVREWVAAHRMPAAGGRSEKRSANNAKRNKAGQRGQTSGSRAVPGVPLPNSDRDAVAEAAEQVGARGRGGMSAESAEQALERELAGMSIDKAARVRVLIGRARNLDLDAAIKSGIYMKRQEVEEGRRRRIIACKTAFEQVPRRIAPDLVGQTVDVIEQLLSEEVERVLHAFAGSG